MQPVYPIRNGFGRRKYMQRSQKRRRVSHSVPTPPQPSEPSRKPRRPRKKRAGFFYGCATFVLLITLWPIGLVLLWQRKVRWHFASKLLTSVLTLAACILLLGFALTVDTGDTRYTVVQDTVNAYLDNAAANALSFGEYAGERITDAFEEAKDFGSAFSYRARNTLADGIEAGVDLAAPARKIIASKSAASPAADDTEKSVATPAQAATPAPAVKAGSLPVYVPGSRPDVNSGTRVTGGMLRIDGSVDEEEPFNTVNPETLARTFTVKSAGEAIVYYNNGSKYYHRTEQCGSMQTSTAHAFEETRDKKYRQCTACGAPDKALLDETEIAWVDENNVAHLSDECTAFNGAWTLMTAERAVGNGCAGCGVCGANRYLEAVAAGTELILRTVEPAVEASAEPDTVE